MLNKKTLIFFSLAFVIYLFTGFNAPLQRDPGIYIYSANMALDGIPPYKSIFDHKGPGAPLILASLAKLYSIFSKDILGEILFIRVITIFLISLIPILIFFISLDFLNENAAFLTSLVFITFFGFTFFASAPRPKGFMLLFETLFLLFIIRKNYLWAGFFASAAAIVWQPMGLFVLAGLYDSIKEKKWKKYIAGSFILPVLTLFYFVYHGSLNYLWDGMVLFNLKYLDTRPIISNIENIRTALKTGYSNSTAFILLGIFLFIQFYRKKEFPRILLYSFPLPILWSIADFQGPPDMFPLLPYAALGLGYLFQKIQFKKYDFYIVSLALVLIAIVPHRPVKTSLSLQYEEAIKVKERFNGEIITIGAPHFMALAGLKNPSRYLFVLRGIDKKIEQEYPNGIDGWLNFLMKTKPKALVIGEIKGEHAKRIKKWIRKNFRKSETKSFFKVFVRIKK